MADELNVQERLAAMAALFDETEASSSLFDPPGPGDYTGPVDRFDFFEGGTPKQLYVKVTLQVGPGQEYAGRRAEVVTAMEDPEWLPKLKALFDTLAGPDRGVGVLGRHYRLTDISPESPFLESLLDVPVAFRVAESKKIKPETGKPYLNVYVNERLGPPIRNGSNPASAQQRMAVQQEQPHDELGSDAAAREFKHTAGTADVPPATDTVVRGAPMPKVDGCVCPAPESGVFFERCAISGHGIAF